jgi:dihydroxyacetone kinase phosphoprotein-dependent L subunit
VAGALITAQDLRSVLSRVAQKIAERESYLNSLDAATGDGDHGITMRLGFQAVVRKLSELDSQAGMDVIWREAGMAFMGASGGAIGVILGKMLMAGGNSLRGAQHLGAPEFRNMLGAMETAIANAGKAKPGDKTILDAVHGANLALAGPEATTDDLPLLVSQAAQAAKRAAQDTAGMVCRVGRASRLGDRTLGCPDPGAVSFSLILGEMAEWLGERQASFGPVASRPY